MPRGTPLQANIDLWVRLLIFVNDFLLKKFIESGNSGVVI